jgi:CheY-like chemotaxis protein/two-component sensor histidine kinase
MVSDRMASVGTLAAGVAHEINNPLAAVLANIDLATREVSARAEGGAALDVPELLDELLQAREAARRVRQIVRDLRIFSRSEVDATGPVDLTAILESTLRMAWNEIRHRARLVKDFEVVPAVEGNESRLGQVFLNLIVNAAQAIPEGRAESNQIRVRLGQTETGQIEVAITDTGPGIPPEVQQRLFTPFFTTKPPGVGTGLGLSICHKIISSIGGSIEVDTEVGRGTTFRVLLRPALVDPKASEAPPPQPSASTRRGHILVVDDEAMILSAIKRILAPDHEVSTFRNGQQALEKIRGGERYDVILCDLMMPEITGMDFYAEVAKLSAEQAKATIFLTGGAFTARARSFLDEVKNERIEKPFDAANLRAIVNEHIA